MITEKERFVACIVMGFIISIISIIINGSPIIPSLFSGLIIGLLFFILLDNFNDEDNEKSKKKKIVKKNGLSTSIKEVRNLLKKLEKNRRDFKKDVGYLYGTDTKVLVKIINRVGLSDTWEFEE